MEGAAILSYLTRHFDPEHKLSFTKDPELSICEQWVAWQHGGLGPMQVSDSGGAKSRHCELFVARTGQTTFSPATPHI